MKKTDDSAARRARPEPLPESLASVRASRRLPLLTAVALSTVLAACGDGKHPASSAEIMHGERIYMAECASCHGANLEGQPDWRNRRADGKLPAPPHDATGHTWHHSREQLFAIIQRGMVPPNAPEGYLTDMPAFGDKLSQPQIEAVLSFIESRWPDAIHAERQKRFAPKS